MIHLPTKCKSEKEQAVIIAPSNSMSYINNSLVEIGKKRLNSELNLDVSFGAHVNNEYLFTSARPEERAEDIHEALLNKNTAIIMAAYGGYNTNDILPYLNYSLILERNIPFIGYSDITVLLNAIYAKTGVSTILGPSFTAFCDPNMFNESLYSLKKILEKEKNIQLVSPAYCACDDWFFKEKFGPRDKYLNQRWRIFREGTVSARLIGGNLESFLTLLGTPYFPDYEEYILLLEANLDEPPGRFVRDLVHLKQLGVFDKIKGLIIGQFHKESALSKGMMHSVLSYIFKDYCYPIIYNANFSHVDPLLALPIGGEIKLIAQQEPSIIVYPEESQKIKVN